MNANESPQCSFNPDQFSQELYSALKHDLSAVPSTVVSGTHTLDRHQIFLHALLKKYKSKGDTNAETRRIASIDKFLANLSRMDEIAGPLSTFLSECIIANDDRNCRLSNRPYVRQLLAARALVGDFCTQYPFDEEVFIKSVRSSSGASIGVPYTDPSPRQKWTFPISVTSRALPTLQHYINADPLLRESLEMMNRKNGNQLYRVVAGSKHFVVNKDDKIDRNCGKEPTWNMNCQLALMDQMVHGLKEHPLFRLDITVLPERHQQLAKKASIDLGDATIDCSNASDSILLVLVEFLFSSNMASKVWFEQLKTFRSDNIEVDHKQHLLPIISTMGNAYTFPLETLVFYALSVSAVYVDENPHSRSVLVDPSSVKKVSVFGDDIIVPTKNANSVINLLQKCGIEINTTKSFFDDYPFRESCGGDFFAGHDVRPLSIKEPPQGANNELAWLYIIFNGLVSRIHSVYGLPYEDIIEFSSVKLVRDHLKQLSEQGIFVVPPHFPDSSGIQVLPIDTDIFLSYVDFSQEIFIDTQDIALFPCLTNVYSKERRRFDFLSYALSLRQGPTTVDIPDLVEYSKQPVWKKDEDTQEFARKFRSAQSPSKTTKIREAARWDVSYGYSSGLFSGYDLKTTFPTLKMCISISIDTHVGKRYKGLLKPLPGKVVGPAVVLE